MWGPFLCYDDKIMEIMLANFWWSQQLLYHKSHNSHTGCTLISATPKQDKHSVHLYMTLPSEGENVPEAQCFPKGTRT